MKDALRSALWLIVPLLAAAPSAAAPDARATLLEQRREALRLKWEAQFRAADTDADRRLTEAECRTAKLPPALLQRFAEIDADADGALSPEEMLAAHEQRLQAQRARHGPRP